MPHGPMNVKFYYFFLSIALCPSFSRRKICKHFISLHCNACYMPHSFHSHRLS